MRKSVPSRGIRRNGGLESGWVAKKSAWWECGAGGRVKDEVGRGWKMQGLEKHKTPRLDPEGNRAGE